MEDGSVTIEVTLTKRQLEQGLKNVKNSLEDLQNNSKSISNKIANEFDKIGKSLESVGKKLSIGLTAPIVALSASGIKYNMQLEKNNSALTTLTGSAEEAEKIMKQIEEDAAKTPFDVSGLTQANQLLISTGLSADDSRETILALGNAISATGGGNEELSRMAVNLQQIKNTGKAAAIDIKQFAFAGIDIYGLLADYLGITKQEATEMEVTWEDLNGALINASKEGGKYFGAMQKQSETTSGAISNLKDSFNRFVSALTKSLMPTVKKIINKITDWLEIFEKLDDSTKDNIIKIGLFVGAIGPALTIIGKLTKGVSGTITAISTFAQACQVAAGTATTSKESVKMLSSVISGLTSPVGIAITVLTALVAVIGVKLYNANKKVQEGVENFSNAMSNYVSGFSEAEGYLNEFNNTVFATNQEQEELKNQMAEIQEGITKICKTASDERREYTQEEINKLKNYFEEMRALEEKEAEIQKQKGQVIVETAKVQEQTLKDSGASFSEYTQKTQEWVKTISEQAQVEQDTAYEAYINTIANLNALYSEEQRINNAEYENAKKSAWDIYQARIDAATKQVADVNAVFSQGAIDRVKLNDELTGKLEKAKKQQLEIDKNYANAKKNIEDTTLLNSLGKYSAMVHTENAYKFNNEAVWKEVFENMDESSAKQLSVWITMLAQDEMYGNKITEQDRKMINTILDHYDYLPEGARNSIKDAMQGLYNGMTSHQQSLFAKAEDIAGGIINKMKSKFQIHSPSKVMRKMFGYVMQGGELGLADEEKNIYKQVDKISENILSNFNLDIMATKLHDAVMLENGKISAQMSSSLSKSFTAHISIAGDTYFDSEKVGRVIAPAVTKTFRSGGAYA